MAKPTGYLYWRKTGWRASVKLEINGERVRKSSSVALAAHG